MEHNIIAIVGCGKAKRGQAGDVYKARRMYTSAFFKLKKSAARAHADDWYIFSAEYGLLDPNEEIKWYDTNINDLSQGERKRLIKNATSTIKDCDPDGIIIFLGRDYATPLKKSLNIPIADPLAGVGLFEQQKMLKHLQEDPYTTEQIIGGNIQPPTIDKQEEKQKNKQQTLTDFD